MKKILFIFILFLALTIGTASRALAIGTPGATCENEGDALCDEEDKDCQDTDPIGYTCVDIEKKDPDFGKKDPVFNERTLDDEEEKEEEPSPTEADEEVTPSPTPLPEGRTNNLCSGEDKQTCAMEGRPELNCSQFNNYVCRDTLSRNDCFCDSNPYDLNAPYIQNRCAGGVETASGTRYFNNIPFSDNHTQFFVPVGNNAILSILDIGEDNIKYTVRECRDRIPGTNNSQTECPIVDTGFGTEVGVSCELDGIPKPQETFIKFEKVESGGTGGGACGGHLDFEPLCNATNVPTLKARWFATPLRGADTCNIYIRAGEHDYTVSHECTSTGVTFTQLTDIEDGETLELEQDSGPYQLWVSNGVDDETNAESCLDEQVSETMLACSATPSPTNTPPPGATRTPTSRPGSATATPRPRGPTPTPAPTLDKRSITATCTGGKFTLDWGPVIGAGGYKVQLFDVTSGITPTPVRTPRNVPVTGTHAETTVIQGRSYNWLLAVTDARGVEDDRKGSERVNIFCPAGPGAVSPTTTPIPTIPPEDTALLTKIGVTETSSKCVDVQGVTNYSIKDTQTDTYTPLGQIDITGDGTTTQADRDRLAQTIQKLPEGDPRLCSSRPQ